MGNNGGGEKIQGSVEIREISCEFFLVGHRSDTRKYAEDKVGKVGPEGRHSLLALTSSGPSVN